MISSTATANSISTGSQSGPCGACKFLRRKCVEGCVFAPYFDAEQGAAHFAAVHKVFGASNVSKLLLHVPTHKRPDAVLTLCYEAQARLRDPVYGCISHIFALQHQVVNLQTELTYLQAHLASVEAPAPPPPPQPMTVLPQLSISDLPSASIPPPFDLSCLFDSMLQHQQQPPPSWPLQAQLLQPPTHAAGETPTPAGPADPHALVRELIRRHNSRLVGLGLCSDPTQPPSLSD